MSSSVCSHCGAFGDLPHVWVEDTCVLPHRTHSFRLLPGAFVCVPCVDRWRDRLTEVVELYATLGEVLLAGSIPDDTAEHKRPRKAPASPSPLNLTAWSLMHPETLNSHLMVDGEMRHAGRTGLPDIADVLSNWAEALWDRRGYGDGWPTTISGAAAALIANIEIMAKLPDVDEFDAELHWIHRSLRTAHHITDPQSYGACLSVDCRGQVWPAKQADDPALCDRCGRRYRALDKTRVILAQELARKQAAS